ncbi:MAG: phosphatase PAP2 family protein [Planctomycetota bacterium]
MSTPPLPFARHIVRPGRAMRLSPLRIALLAGTAALLTIFDRAIYHAVEAPGIEGEDWYQVLRQLGYMPTWIIVALLLYLVDRNAPPPHLITGPLTSPVSGPRPWKPSQPRRPAHHRAGLLLLSATLAGLAAETLKAVCRRYRPEAADGHYLFDPWLTATGTDALGLGHMLGLGIAPDVETGFGLPSGHTAVAFGACAMLGMLIPPIKVPLLLLAAGCGFSRMLAGAHYSTDVLVGAVLGIAVAGVLFKAGERPGVPLDRA